MNATEKLLKAHQEIIDAWFARWRQQEKQRIDELFERKRSAETTIRHRE